MYDKTPTPPEPGSPLELVFLMIWKMRQQIEFQKSRVTVQALLAQKGVEDKHVKEAFEDLKDAFFPYDKNARRTDLKKMREAMYSELARGPLSITALSDPNQKKIQSKLARGQAELTKHKVLTEAGKLTQMDTLERARRRARTAS